jgi:hypothetical protein
MRFIVSTNLGENVYSIAKPGSTITQFGNAINIFSQICGDNKPHSYFPV